MHSKQLASAKKRAKKRQHLRTFRHCTYSCKQTQNPAKINIHLSGSSLNTNTEKNSSDLHPNSRKNPSLTGHIPTSPSKLQHLRAITSVANQPIHQATILEPTDGKMATEPMDTTISPPAASTDPSQSQNKRQKTSHSQSTPATKPSTLQTLTLRSPPWSYIHLQQIHHNQASQQTPLDPLTVHLHLTQALHTFLGLHGAAIPIDILKLDSESESSSSGEEQSGGLWIRVPSQDRAAVLAAVGGWVGKGGEGWRVLGWSSWGIGGIACNSLTVGSI